MQAHETDEKPLEMLSPFELKDLLIEIAEESIRTRAAVMLNAGRGNPNWIATTPREAFFLLGSFAMAEARRTWNECFVIGIVMPEMSASWNASVPIRWLNTWPVIATSGTESM